MKKKLLLFFILIGLTNSLYAVDYASEYDSYSTQEPSIEKGYKNSKTNINSTYFYNENDSYHVATRAGYITTILLNPDEDIIHAEIGDATRWSVQTYYTGSSKGMSPALSVKPFVPELKTNLVISTTKRIYNIVLEAKVNSYAPIINFEYPKETWSPIQIFDDGEQTFLVMSEKVRATELPVLFIKDEQTGEGASVRYRYDPETRYYTVDRLFKQATLRYGNKEIIIKRKGSFIKSPNDHISVSI